MPSAEPPRLTDDLWLAAHGSVNGRPSIGDWPLGVGLATGLLAELVHDRELLQAAGAQKVRVPGDPGWDKLR